MLPYTRQWYTIQNTTEFHAQSLDNLVEKKFTMLQRHEKVCKIYSKYI